MTRIAIPDHEVGEELGRGGMGVVYVARHTSLDREVAVKVFPAASLEEEQRARFLREVRISIGLSHPHLVRFFDAGATDAWLWLAMERVRGTALDRHVFQEGPLAPQELLRLMVALADALEFVHARGIVHRDIKPANVMIDERGAAKLMDFGLARKEGNTLLTDAGSVLGSPRYLAPESITHGTMDRRSDLYGLGITFHEAATGVPLFNKANLKDTLAAIVGEDVPRPSRKVRGFPKPFEDVILKLVDKDPARRFASATELRAALEEAGGWRPEAGASSGAAFGRNPPVSRSKAAPRSLRPPDSSHRSLSDSFVLGGRRAPGPLAALGVTLIALVTIAALAVLRPRARGDGAAAPLTAPPSSSGAPEDGVDDAIVRARAVLDSARLDAALREIHVRPPADRLAKRIGEIAAGCRDLIDRAPAVLDSAAPLAVKKRVYDALTAPRTLDRALALAMRADLALGAERALGRRFQVGAVHRRRPSDTPSGQVVWEPAQFLGIKGSALSSYGTEIEAIVPATGAENAKVAYELTHEMELPAGVAGARRAAIELSLNIPGDDDLFTLEVAGWKLLCHAGCGDPRRTDVRRKFFSHDVDPRLFAPGKVRVTLTRASVSAAPTGVLVGAGGVTLQFWRDDEPAP